MSQTAGIGAIKATEARLVVRAPGNTWLQKIGVLFKQNDEPISFNSIPKWHESRSGRVFEAQQKQRDSRPDVDIGSILHELRTTRNPPTPKPDPVEPKVTKKTTSAL